MAAVLSPDVITRYAQPAPRYTSYPTAPHFHEGVNAHTLREWLAALPEQASLSLYAHMPFCDTLCWFCGCSTKITRQYRPVAAYLDALLAEIGLVGAMVPTSAVVHHIHWGGGSPTILAAGDIRRLMEALRRRFTVAEEAEFAVEIDPRGLDRPRIDALADSGLTRVSIGVQDFDPAVQAAINRIQTVAETRRVIDAFRGHGVASLNIDAIYGLPGQGRRELIHTLTEVVAMQPDRIALFGYAHVPWMKRHQTMIDERALPGVLDRHAHAQLAADFLASHGYERIGIDHFALPHDSMAVAARAGTLRRNFQGYTVDAADALIGLGASAIGRLPQGFVQNVSSIGTYQRRVLAGDFATERGVALTREDEVRAAAIEQIMCTLAFSADELARRFGADADPVIAEAAMIASDDEDGFIIPRRNGFAVSEAGRPFARTIASRFDAYLPKRTARHSLAV